MAKMDDLRKSAGGNVLESMGGGLDASSAVFSPMQATPARLVGIVRSKDAAQIQVDRIEADPGQPREDFDQESLERLAESLRTRGQLQPIRVRWNEPSGHYRIVCGERRWRAAKLAGLPAVSAVIVEGPLSASDLLAIQLIENALREDLRPIEQARAYQTLMERHDWSTRQLAKELAVAQPQVVRTLALLSLPAGVQEQVEQGAIAPATAYEIGKLDDPDAQEALAARVVDEKMTRQEAVESVREQKANPSRPNFAEGPGDRSEYGATETVKRSRTRPAPVEIRVNEAVTVTVKYRKADRLTVVQALRAALKTAQQSEKDGDAE